MTERRAILTFDVEEFDVPVEYGQAVEESVQMAVGAEGLARVLDLLDQCGAPATMFTTAHFARHHPELMRRAAARHEIASHGFYHSRFTSEDLAASRAVLREITGQEIIGFRMARMAPVDHAAIAAAGYRYNSSDNPIWLPGRYNNLRKPRGPYRSGNLWNIPVSASPVLRIPLFWLAVKNFPLALIHAAAARTLAHDGAVNFYFHPWEFVDLGGYRLPWYIRRRSGRPMLHRVAQLIDWLQARATLVPMETWVEHLATNVPTHE